jgi:general secretion pathway protein G
MSSGVIEMAQPAHRRERGVTLLEMLVVLIIIAMIAGLVGVRLVSQVDRSKTIAAKAQIEMLNSAVESLRIDIGRLPAKEEGLTFLVTPPPSAANWFGPYIDGDLPSDPWGRPYVYAPAPDAKSFYLYSLGEDGVPGGSGAAQDVGRLPPSSGGADTR